MANEDQNNDKPKNSGRSKLKQKHIVVGVLIVVPAVIFLGPIFLQFLILFMGFIWFILAWAVHLVLMTLGL